MKDLQPTELNFKLDLKPAKELPKGFYEVINPLFVFKQIFSEGGNKCIANLIIPAGEIIYVGLHSKSRKDKITQECMLKMRASKAYVHSIVREMDHKQLKEGRSWWVFNFKYNVGAIVKPSNRFLDEQDVCGSGIHFFFNVNSALLF